MGIDPGKLRHRVTLNRATWAQDAVGELQPSWSAVGDYWAFVKPLSGRELWNARQVTPLVTHSVTMRNVGPITSKDQLLFEGRVLDVDSVYRVDEVNEFYSVMAIERPPADS